MTLPAKVETPALEVRSLSVAYKSRGKFLPVLHDVSFSIATGEAYGLVGESGCGKTTTAMAVMSYFPDNAVVQGGSVSVLGEDILSATPEELRAWRGTRMAMVYQDPGSALNPTMRVGRQVAEVYRFHGGATWDEAMDQTRAMFETVRFADAGRILERYPHELSGGQQQRIMIAMALAADPALLLLDEPTTGLDATVEADIIDLIVDLRVDLGTATLFISHNLGVVSRLCDRVGVLYAGRLIEEGATNETLSAPRHPYTRGLIDSVPRWGATKKVSRLQPIPGDLPLLGVKLPGCVFAPRCSIAQPQCVSTLPDLEICASGDQRSACFFRDELSERLASTSVSTPVVLSSRRADEPKSTVVTVDHVTKRFRGASGDLMVLNNVSLTLNNGEILGLVGESGSGKTTLARTIAGLYTPDEGRIIVGDDSRSSDGRAQFLQMVFQNPDTALNPSHSVAHILARAVKRLGLPMTPAQRRKQVLKLAHSVALQGYHLQLRPRELSGGLKQRVAIGRAFAGSPTVVLLDEPASALDVSVQATILNLLVDLQIEFGLSYLLITHDLAVVNYLADRIAVMYLGEIVEIGPTSTVIKPPHHPYTEALLSANSAANSTSGKRIILQGQMPSLANPPSGCRFHTRCPRSLGDQCRDAAPPEQSTDQGHSYRCHIAPDELARLQASPLS